MSERKMLAVDLGASSGRGIVGTFNGKTISLEEIHRFSNDPVIVGGRMFGVIGILLGVPVIAILDYLFRQVIIPKVRARREKAIRKANGISEDEPLPEAEKSQMDQSEDKMEDK